MPFGKEPVIEMGAGNSLYFGRSDSLFIQKKPIKDPVHTVISHAFSRVELTDDLIRARLKMRGDKDLLKKIGTIQEKAPSHIPVFEDFEVDVEGRVWVAVNTRSALEDGFTEYWIFDAGGDRIRRISFDGIVFLKAFDDQSAYGVKTKPSGLQQIVRAPLDSLLPSSSS
jgi:hypothetical protein